MRPNNICCLGGNYLGGLSSCVIALKCPEVRVVVVDKEETISKWNNSTPYNEPGLDQILKKCRHRNLFFVTDYAYSISEADMIFIPMDVPIRTVPPRKRVLDFKDLEEAGKLIAAHSKSDKIVVEKSTVCGRAVDKVSAVLESCSTPGVQYHVLSNPTNIAEGSAVNDLSNPKSVLIGCKKNANNKAAVQSLCDLYEHWVPREKIKVLDNWSAEVAYLSGNLFLAQTLSSINGLANICEELGIDVTRLTKCLNKDSRLLIETSKPSLGFGSFQKDLSSFILMCDALQLPEVASYWQTVLELKSYQTKRFQDKIKTILDPLEGKEIGILGFAQTKNTIETKYSLALDVCQFLLENNCTLKIYDPRVPAVQILKDLEWRLGTEFVTERKNKFKVVNNVTAAYSNSSAVILCTDWDEFRNLNFSKIANSLCKPVFIDGHNLWEGNSLTALGLEYHTVG